MALLRAHEKTLALVMGYLLTAGAFYGLGVYSAKNAPPDIRIEEPAIDVSQIHNIANPAGSQSAVAGQSAADDCAGRIKGNISSSSRIYHVPGGAFYNRTNPEMCFDTEAEAQAAGFRRSQR